MANSPETINRFLATTLHEIRTPIQTILSTSELMSDTSLDKEQFEYVRQIEFSANVLLQLANEILDFTKFNSNEFSIENIPYDVTVLTENVIDLVAIEAFNKGLEIVTDIDFTLPQNVMGDPTRVQQVLLNLIKNAVKFTSEGYVLVKLTNTDNQLFFQIIDSGIGIPDDKKKLIFKDFYQVDASTTRKYGGTGLGLSISKKLIDAMHGKIGIKDNPHGGTIFWFSLPLEDAGDSPEKLKQPVKIPENTKILVVDNSKLGALSLEKKLASFGITDIQTATNGKDALELLKTAATEGKPFTAAFIDLIMPKMDGWRLAALINKNSLINNLLLYLVIPEGQMGSEAKMKLLEWFNGYLYKPVKKQQLKEILTSAFTQSFDLEPVDSAATHENKAAEQKNQLNIQLENAAKGLKILVTEDHPMNRKILETFLTRYGAKVILAEDGQQAVKQISKHPDTDMIFMDIQMPVKNGVDATIELRKKNYKGIIIACTANNDEKDFQEYRAAGINDILVKPFKRETIYQIIEKWRTVLSFPEGKSIVTITDLSNSSDSIWNMSEFNEIIDGDKSLGCSLIDDYLEQTKKLLTQIKAELAKKLTSFEKLHIMAHTLKGSSAAISAESLTAFAKEMDEAAKAKNHIKVEAARTNFAIDFLKFQNITKDWKNSL